jgi:hypothetical protein
MTVAQYPITIEGETASIGTAGELVVALDVLQGQHDRAVLEQLAPHLSEIIADASGLYWTLKELSVEDQLYLFDALGPCLVDVIGRASALRDLLATMAHEEVEERMLKALGAEGLHALIGTAEELAGVLEWVYGDCDRLVLDLVGAPFLRRLFPSGYGLSLALHALDHDRQQDLVEMLGWEQVEALVHDRRDLAHLLRALPGDLSTRLLKGFTKAQLWDLARDERGRRYLYQYLEAEEATYLDKAMGENDAE